MPPVTIINKQIVGRVDKLDKNGEVKDTEEIKLGEMVVSDDVPMANVGVKLGKTKNLGDYESLRVDVSLFMPSETDKKSLNKTFKKCLTWCDNKMDEVLN
jgi:hypothetical protein